MGTVTDTIVSEAEARGVEVIENDSASVDAATGTMWLVGIASVVGAALGIVGGALAKKKGIIAGILLVAAAIPSFFTEFGVIASVLFIIGGILALIPQKTSQKVVA